MATIDATDLATDPNAQALISQILSDRAEAAQDATNDRPKVPLPADAEVKLPGGRADIFAGTLDRTAEVRELNGDDEEALAKVSNNFARLVDTILQRGTVSVGETKATKDVLDDLLAADRDYLLLAIRRATLGDEIEFTATCPECQEKQEPVVSLTDDVPVKLLDDPLNDRFFVVDLPSGRKADVHLPDGHAQRALASVSDPTEASLKSVLLRNCVDKINGVPVISEDQVRALSIRDRKVLMEAIEERNPGPRLREVTRPCRACGADIALPLSTGDLFPF